MPNRHAHKPLPRPLWALMVGNFVIGTGVMAVPGTLNDISHSLRVSIPQAGLLITAGAILMGVGAPLFASLVAGWDRRRLLTLSLLWYALFMGISAFAPSYGWLLPLRVLAVIPPAIFTPQAAACVGLLVKPDQRGRAITFVFLGWSAASVMGMPLNLKRLISSVRRRAWSLSEAARSVSRRAASRSTAMSASMNWMAWCCEMGTSNVLRTFE